MLMIVRPAAFCQRLHKQIDRLDVGSFNPVAKRTKIRLWCLEGGRIEPDGIQY
jgi:hypothetical protein